MAKMTAAQEQAVAGVFATAGIPEYVWRSVMNRESGGNTSSNAVTSKEDSRGLFQINAKVHPQYQGLDLFNPVVNAQIAARDFIAPAYQKAVKAGYTDPGMIAQYVWKNGIRPDWKGVVKRGADKLIYQEANQIAGTAGTQPNFNLTSTVPPGEYDPATGLKMPDQPIPSIGDTYNGIVDGVNGAVSDVNDLLSGKWVYTLAWSALAIGLIVVGLIITFKAGDFGSLRK